MDEQRVTVGRGMRDPAGRDRGAAAADILDNEVLLELVLQRLGENTRHLVGRSARRVGDNDSDSLARIGLRPSRYGENEKADNGQHECGGALHSFLPACFQEAYAAGMIANTR